jgi:LuxR family maltose regulon positive regulatory protein
VATVERWFEWLEDRGVMETHPSVAVLAAMLAAITGKPAEAERWASIAERGATAASLPDGSPTTEPWLALLRALLCRDGPDQMRADAELAARTMAARSFFQAAATLYRAMAHLMTGDRDGVDLLFEDQVAQGRAIGVMVGPCIALAERALLAVGRGAWDLAGQYLAQARSVAHEAHLEEYPTVAIMHAAAAQVALHQGDLAKVRAELTCAQRLRPHVTYAIPYLAVQVRIELARCYLALQDTAAARTLLREADEILRRRPRLGVFVQQADDLRAELAQVKSYSTPGASALTAAELRLLPMLSTHLSLPEIAQGMFLSPNTIKSQAYSLYRKLGASSRSQAVAQAGKLALLEP